MALLPAALAIGRLLDQLADRARDPAGLPGAGAGLFAAIGTVICARDLSQNPEQLVVAAPAAKLAWPPGLDLPVAGCWGWASPAPLAALVLTARPPGESRPARWLRRAQPLAPVRRCWRRPLASWRWCWPTTWSPRCRCHLSTKHLVDRFHRHAGPGAALALVPGASLGSAMFQRAPHAGGGGHRGPGPGVPGAARAVRPRPPRRAGAASRTVSAGRAPATWWSTPAPSRLLLLAARRLPGQPDQNPLHRRAVATRRRQRRRSALARAPPAADQHVRRRHRAGGRRLPGHACAAPGPLPLTLHFRVTAPPAAGLQDLRPPRAPGRRCSTAITRRCEGMLPHRALWRPGDLLRDQHTIAIPLVVSRRRQLRASTSASGRAATTPAGCRSPPAPSDGRDRVHVGTVEVQMNAGCDVARQRSATTRRLGWLVLLGALLLYLPGAGSYGLWDPWETHYGEVARQMTTRGDFISLWWPGSPRETAVFQTKPVLSFWLMSLGMHVAGIGAAGRAPGRDGPGHRAPSGRCARRSACWGRWASRRLPGDRAPGRPARRRAGRAGDRHLSRCTRWWPARR